jgi:hypothetical protein
MSLHLPEAAASITDSPASDQRLTAVTISRPSMIDPDWEFLERELNDRISMAVEYGYWKSSGDVLEDEIPQEQLKTVEKILAICRTDAVLYVTGTIRPDGSGSIVAVTTRLFVLAELKTADGSKKFGSFTSRVWAQSRSEISSVEIVEVSEARHDVSWPTRVRLNLMIGRSELSLPMAKSHQVAKEENLAGLLPALLDDLARS